MTARYPAYAPNLPLPLIGTSVYRETETAHLEQVIREVLAHQTQLAAVVRTLTATVAAGSSNVCEVTITAKDSAGATLAGVFNFDLWLSDATTGAGLTATTASGGIAAKAASGVVLSVLTAAKAVRVQTLATGIFILAITDTAKTAFKVCAQVPGSGLTVVLKTLITANYG